MGTRNLTMVILGGKHVIAQYAQWDGYPSGQGKTVLEFLRETFDREKFINRVNTATKLISDEEYTKLQTEVLGHDVGDFINMTDYKKWSMVYPTLARDLGANVLEFVQNGQIAISGYDFSDGKMTPVTNIIKGTDPIPLRLDVEFLQDSTFCEWAYKVDLDANEFVVYESGDNVRATFKLNKLPTVKTFIKKFERSDD